MRSGSPTARTSPRGEGGAGTSRDLHGDRDGGDDGWCIESRSEHDSPGLAVSPDGRDIAFIAPAPDGFFQVFRMPVAGGDAG